MNLSRIIRRAHMYLGLFFAPWMLMYALSTMAMNHRDWISGFYDETPTFVTEAELTRRVSFPEDASPREQGQLVLQALDLEGGFSAQRLEEGKLVIRRNHAVHPRRITYDIQSGHLHVERELFETPRFLEQMHRRRGFQQDYLLEDVWALSVDLVIITIVVWAFSGVWMWWELKATRLWGITSLIFGFGLFALFLLII